MVEKSNFLHCATWMYHDQYKAVNLTRRSFSLAFKSSRGNENSLIMSHL